MSTNPPSAIRHSQSPLADSPWLWLMVFGLAALIGGALIAPKYGRRMDRVERMHDARVRAYVERIDGELELPPTELHREVSLRELLMFVAVVMLGGGVLGRWLEVRRGRMAMSVRSADPHQ